MKHLFLSVTLTFSSFAIATSVDTHFSCGVAAAGVNHAAVVVEHGNSAVIKQCVAFTSSQISGEQLLIQSGISYQTMGGSSFGNAVCQIDNEPSSYPSNCFGTQSYWAIFAQRGSANWSLSNKGISSLQFNDGDAEGFRYESQSGPILAPPDGHSVCTNPSGGDSDAGSSSNSSSSAGSSSGGNSISGSGTKKGTAPSTTSSTTIGNNSPSNSTGLNSSGSVSSGSRNSAVALNSKVLALTQPRSSSKPSSSATSWLWVLVAITVGGLLGLLATQLLQRRTRKT